MVLQSHMPDHYALGHACAQDYDAFYERELEFRRTMGYPPVAALVNLIVRATDAAKGASEADALASTLRAARAAKRSIGQRLVSHLAPGDMPMSGREKSMPAPRRVLSAAACSASPTK